MVNSWINTVKYHNFDGIHSQKSPRVFDMNLISNQMKSQHYLMFELERSYFRSEEFESEIANSKFSIGKSKLSGSLAKVCFFSLQVQHSDEPIASKWVTNDQCISISMAFTISKRENVQISTPEISLFEQTFHTFIRVSDFISLIHLITLHSLLLKDSNNWQVKPVKKSFSLQIISQFD